MKTPRFVLTGIAVLGLAAPAFSRAETPRPKVQAPSWQNPKLVRSEYLEALFNARGDFEARFDRSRLSIRSSRPALHLERTPKGIELKAGKDLGTEAERSVTLLIAQVDGRWKLVRAVVQQDAKRYLASRGEVTVTSYDPKTGAIAGTFSVTVEREGRPSEKLVIEGGTFDVKP